MVGFFFLIKQLRMKTYAFMNSTLICMKAYSIQLSKLSMDKFGESNAA